MIELLRSLDTQLRDLPLWIVGACSRDRLADRVPLRALLDETDAEHVVRLRRLDRDSVFEVASSLVGTEQSEVLAEFIHRSSQGLPHALAESVNLLRDRGLLRPESGRWSLQEASLAEVQLKLGDLRGLIAERVKHLPYSARRLAALAAVAGSRFEAGLIADAAEEHPVVCDIAFDIMLQRWLIRRSPDRWYHRTRPPRAASGDGTSSPSRLIYEFSSESIWKAIYGDIQTTRRRLMHREIAETLERVNAADLLAVCESLAYHFRAAGLHDRAIDYLAPRGRQGRALRRRRDRAALLRAGRGRDRRRAAPRRAGGREGAPRARAGTPARRAREAEPGGGLSRSGKRLNRMLSLASPSAITWKPPFLTIHSRR